MPKKSKIFSSVAALAIGTFSTLVPMATYATEYYSISDLALIHSEYAAAVSACGEYSSDSTFQNCVTNIKWQFQSEYGGKFKAMTILDTNDRMMVSAINPAAGTARFYVDETNGFTKEPFTFANLVIFWADAKATPSPYWDDAAAWNIVDSVLSGVTPSGVHLLYKGKMGDEQWMIPNTENRVTFSDDGDFIEDNEPRYFFVMGYDTAGGKHMQRSSYWNCVNGDFSSGNECRLQYEYSAPYAAYSYTVAEAISEDTGLIEVNKAIKAAKAAENAAREAEATARAAEEAAKSAEKDFRAAEAAAQAAEQSAREAETAAREAEAIARTAELDAKTAQEIANQAILDAQTAEQAAKEAEATLREAEIATREAEASANSAAELARLAEENANKLAELARLAEANAKKAEETAKAAEEQARLAEENAKTIAKNAKEAEESAKIAEANAKKAEEDAKMAEESAKKAEDEAKLAVLEAEQKAKDAIKMAEDANVKIDEAVKIAEDKTKDATVSTEALSVANLRIEELEKRISELSAKVRSGSSATKHDVSTLSTFSTTSTSPVTTSSIETEKLETKKDQDISKNTSDDTILLPMTADAKKEKNEFPWWIIVIVFTGIALVLWWFVPSRKNRGNDR